VVGSSHRPLLDNTQLSQQTGWFGGVGAATPPNQLQRCILNDYFNNYKFSKTQLIRSLMIVIEPKHVGAVSM
jgi:hypothetical protein